MSWAGKQKGNEEEKEKKEKSDLLSQRSSPEALRWVGYRRRLVPATYVCK
jgi:hypothetical protein